MALLKGYKETSDKTGELYGTYSHGNIYYQLNSKKGLNYAKKYAFYDLKKAERIFSGRNPMSADRTHVHHILSRMGMSQNAVIWTILISNALLGLIGVVAWKLGVPESWLFLSLLVLTVAHLTAMGNAPSYLRRGRRLFSRWGSF